VVQLNIIAQYFQGINQFDLSELCNGDIPKIPNKIDIAQQLFVIKTGETDQIEYYVENIENTQITADIEWQSDDPGIVTVDNTGIITGVSEGYTFVHIKCCNIEQLVLVTVNNETTDPCSSLPRPLVGTYKSRIFLHGYSEDNVTYASADQKISIILIMNFDKDGYPNTFTIDGSVSNCHVETEYDAYIIRDYFVTRVLHEQHSFHTKPHDLGCYNGYYSAEPFVTNYSDMDIYPNSKTVKIVYWYIDKIVTGVGSF
jgi:hypothetical protein